MSRFSGLRLLTVLEIQRLQIQRTLNVSLAGGGAVSSWDAACAASFTSSCQERISISVHASLKSQPRIVLTLWRYYLPVYLDQTPRQHPNMPQR